MPASEILFTLSRVTIGSLGTLVLILAAGCNSEPAEFGLNRIAFHKVEQSLETKLDPTYQIEPIQKALRDTFGTPDDPKVPELDGMEELLDQDLVKMAAGPYGSDESGKTIGLYRQHCVHCHGISGDGAGPTAAFLNPYPRDYRPGIFKWKSTPVGTPPTHADLKRVIRNGVPGTSMPSFKLLPDEEVEALTHYVKYLTLRGELERDLLFEFSDIDVAVLKPADLRNESEQEYVTELSEEDLKEEQEDLKEEIAELASEEVILDEFVGALLDKWLEAEERVTEPDGRGSEEDLKQSIAAGRKIFFEKGGCATCHGQSALGDGQTAEQFYDDWTEQYFDPKAPEELEQYLALGALPPRKLDPRNLRLGNFRGGRRPIDVFWRIRNGIEGAKMPAAQQLSEDEIWQLVDYVRKGLPFEHLSQPQLHEAENKRLRN